VYLLDVNVLIALAWDDHAHHTRAHAWFAQLARESFATYNVTQSGFVRLSLNPSVVHCQMGIADVFEMLESFTKHPNHIFCEDGALQMELPTWQRITGHTQVTDTNLLLIAHRNGRKFVTLDDGIQNRLQGEEKTWIEVIAL
jgi:toxin-antitoxin system PIN domain toxin